MGSRIWRWAAQVWCWTGQSTSLGNKEEGENEVYTHREADADFTVPRFLNRGLSTTPHKYIYLKNSPQLSLTKNNIKNLKKKYQTSICFQLTEKMEHANQLPLLCPSQGERI